MAVRMSRRQRRVAWTLGASALFVVATVLWAFPGPDETYRPGEAVDGLTARLDRDLPPDAPRLPFTDVTARSGIDFRHFYGTRTGSLPEDMGSGAAWADYDGDGDLDLFVAAVAGPLGRVDPASPVHDALYRNDGDGTFTDVSASAGVDARHLGMGAAWGDYDNDGRPDLFVSAYGHHHLYHNDGDGTFSDAGLDGPEGFWAGAAWGDYDRDGDLDLYVTGYVRYTPDAGQGAVLQYDVETPASLNPSAFHPERNLLYRNRGDGTFEEVARALGVDNPEGRSLGAVWVDFDEDGWPDLYVANDVSDNVLYHNHEGRVFEDVSHPALVADYRGAMGIAVGDWDGDADQDLFLTHWIAQENALYANLRRAPGGGMPGLRFMDVADRYGLGQIALDFIGWGTGFFDFDLDGRLDLFVVNGSTFQDREAPERLIPMRDQLFWNRGPKEGFFDVSSLAGPYFGEEHVGRGAAFADYDDDGDVDVFVINHGEGGVLLRNDGTTGRHWLKVTLEGRRSNRAGVGARVRVVTAEGVQVRMVGAQGSYLSQNGPVAHFGLGEVTRVDTLEVVWPSGSRQLRTALQADTTVHLVEEPAS